MLDRALTVSMEGCFLQKRPTGYSLVFSGSRLTLGAARELAFHLLVVLHWESPREGRGTSWEVKTFLEEERVLLETEKGNGSEEARATTEEISFPGLKGIGPQAGGG